MFQQRSRCNRDFAFLPIRSLQPLPKDMVLPTFVDATIPLMCDHASAIFAAMQYANRLILEHKTTLDLDKTAAICMLLMYFEENDVYSALNKALGDAGDATTSEEILQPWVKYLRLLSEALCSVPNVSDGKNNDHHRVFYLQAQQDLAGVYKANLGQVICWPGFFCCSKSMEALLSPKIVRKDDDGKRTTIFEIRCHRAKDPMGMLLGEESDEVVIMGTTKFRVESVEEKQYTTIRLVEEVGEEGDAYYPILNFPAADSERKEMETNHSYICSIHNEPFSYLCGDKLVCGSCPEHEDGISLEAATDEYLSDAGTKIQIDDAKSTTWQQGLQQGYDKLKKRINQLEAEKNQQCAETERFFDKYIHLLVEMKKSHLKIIGDAVAGRLQSLSEKCSVIETMMEEANRKIEEVEKQNRNLSENVVERYLEVKRASDLSSEIIVLSSESLKQLSRWMNDEKSNKIRIGKNYDVVGKQLEGVIQQFKLFIGKNRDRQHQERPLSTTLRALSPTAANQHIPSIDMRILNAATATPSKVKPVKLIHMQRPFGICRVSSEVIAVAKYNTGKISLLSSSTRTVLRSFGQGILEDPYGICMNNHGHFIVSDSAKNQIFVFDKDDGRLLKASNPAKINLKNPEGICFDHKNERVIIADAHNHRVLLIREDLEAVIESFGTYGTNSGQFDYPVGVGIDSRERIIVSEHDNHRIQVFDEKDDPKAPRGKSYQFSFIFAKHGVGAESNNIPFFLTIDREDHIVVCDNLNNRVQVYKISSTSKGGVLDTKTKIVGAEQDNSIFMFGD